MDIEDLRKFLVIAEDNNLQVSADTLGVTPGALSKVVKRLESGIDQALFDREGRGIKLNQDGRRFRDYARHIVHEADQIFHEFGQSRQDIKVNLAGPSVLLQRYIGEILSRMPRQNVQINAMDRWEEEAINSLVTGRCHIALVTDLGNLSEQEGFVSIPLGQTVFKVVGSEQHSVFKDYPDGKLSTKQLLQYGFACPSVNLFRGKARGMGSDGWRDDQVPRKISYRCDDYSVLLSLVKSGHAIAYVPDYFLKTEPIQVVDVYDCAYTCIESIYLVYQPSKADGWLNHLVKNFENFNEIH